MDPTCCSYDLTAQEYALKVAHRHPFNEAKEFIHKLSQKSRILDLGCGPGRDAKIFADRGFEVIGIDASPKMIEIAKEQVPQAEFLIVLIEEMEFPPEFFEGIWASGSLLHLSKPTFLAVIAKIHTCLQEDGCFYLSLKEGEGEGTELDHRYNGLPKYWAYYREEEVKKILAWQGFREIVIKTSPPKDVYQTHPWMRILCMK